MLRYLTPTSFRIKNSSCWIRLIGESLKNYQQHPLQFIYTHSKYRQRLNNNEMSSVKNENVPAKNEMKKLGKEARKKQTEGDDGDGPEKPSKYVLKPPKGMRDFGQQQMLIRHKVFKIITDAFKRNGALALDTPVVESKQLLTGKYGEDSKLIYDLEEQEGEILSLRYDLTVPFARHLAQNKITKITRYSINAVYRRDNPSITKGRFREFYQCDFDIAGKLDPTVPDSKCLKVLCEILTDLDLKSFIIKVNHRLLLNGMFSVAGVPEEKFKTICSSIDKLGKLTWEEIKQEMCRDKGLDESVADRIGELIKYHGSIEMLNELLSSDLGKNSNAKQGLEDLKILHDLCKKFGIEKNIEFDLSLARGLDYYTGVIYEAVLQDDGLEVGSIAAGGRYDGLVGLLSADKHDVPCVGVSVGIERVLAIIEKRLSLEPSIEVECFVISIGKGMVEERLKIIRELDDAQIAADQLDKGNPKLLPQIQAAEEKNIPFAIMLGENELKDGIVKIRDIKSRAETPIERTKLVEELKKMLKERRSELVEDGNKACSEPEKIIGTSDEISKKMGGDAVEDEKSNQLLGLYTPKGMQDYDPERMLDREQVFDTIVNTFKRAGAQPLDTPVCELKETLLGKYGPEEEKAIFHIADQGGEILSLRYDLTVPFARYLTMFKLSSMKRFHIGKVYRIDNPDKTKGVLREFYQCDFDIAGQSDAMIADSRCLRVLYKSLKDVGIQSFIIKVNMRPILDGVFTLAGATQDKFKTLFTAVDKARKTSWDKIKGDLIKETGLTEAIVDKIGELIKHRGSQEKLNELLNSELGAMKSVQEALESLKILFKYCQALGIEDDAIEFDLSLARGLDYYTGIIFEASLKDPAHSEFGSIAGGGRYDGLVTLLAGSKHKVPAVGFSIGGDRLLAIRELQKTVKVK